MPRSRKILGLSAVSVTLLVVAVLVVVAAFGLGRLTAQSPEGDQTERSGPTGQEGSSTETSAPVEPASEGAELVRLTNPPEKTLWALSADTYAAGVRITVEFQPYGIGPSSFGPSVVVLVTSAEAEDPSAKAPDLEGRNVIFLLGDSVVDKGGTYEGVAVTQAQGDRVVLVLEDVTSVAQE